MLWITAALAVVAAGLLALGILLSWLPVVLVAMALAFVAGVIVIVSALPLQRWRGRRSP